MPYNDYRRDEEDESEDEVDENDFKTQKDAVLFAVDVSSSMLKRPPASNSKKADTDSPVAAALKCAYKIMQQRIIAQPKDLIGILLFGTEKSKFREESEAHRGLGYPQCYLFMDLDIPAAEDVRALRSLVEDGEDPDNILAPSADKVAMSNVLFCANQIFTTNAPNFGSRRLFIITDDDDPHGSDKTARSAAAVRAKDLYDLGIDIELFPISREGKKFDLTKFYDDIIYRDPAADADEVKSSNSGDGITLLSSLISNINSKQTPKRAYFSQMPFEVAPGLTISVKGYINLHRQRAARTCFVWLGGEKPLLAESETVRTDPTTTKSVEKAEIKKAYKFGGEYIYFTTEEQKELKKWDTPGGKGKCLRIIGFKPRSMLPPWASVRRSIYTFPSEDDFIGSTRVFSALWQKLLKDKKMGIAWYISRRNANPLLVALLPSKPESEEDSGTNFLPAGLWLYPLPFADDLREIEKRPSQKCSDGLIDQMRPIVNNLQLPKAMYNPAKYPNPGLQWHYKILQALALEDEIPEPDTDATLPRAKSIANRVGGYLVEFKESLEKEAGTLQKARAVKREADDDDERPAKRAKSATVKKEGTPLPAAELKRLYDQGKISKMTVSEIRDVMKSKGISASGLTKKADLVQKLGEWVEDNC